MDTVFLEKLCKDSLGGFSRGFVRITTEADLAYGQRRIARDIPADAILINANENPLGLVLRPVLPWPILAPKRRTSLDSRRNW